MDLMATRSSIAAVSSHYWRLGKMITSLGTARVDPQATVLETNKVVRNTYMLRPEAGLFQGCTQLDAIFF